MRACQAKQQSLYSLTEDSNRRGGSSRVVGATAEKALSWVASFLKSEDTPEADPLKMTVEVKKVCNGVGSPYFNMKMGVWMKGGVPPSAFFAYYPSPFRP